MKVSELKHIIDQQIMVMPRFADWQVSIHVSVRSIGSRSMVTAKSANFGFDWEHGKFIIEPETPLVPKA